MAWVIVKKTAWGAGFRDGLAWRILPGRRYKSRERAEKARQIFYTQMKRAAEEGLILFDAPDRWLADTAIVEIREGDSAADPFLRAGLPGQLLTTSARIKR